MGWAIFLDAQGLHTLQSTWLGVEWHPAEDMVQSQPPCEDGGLVELASFCGTTIPATPE